ncbi:MAG: hypothetical protein FD123_2712 [Bacteroidetes bacterium]|nr:MAG: hypothetical protein FD123_2712 [Bacteroidota bacterium]
MPLLSENQLNWSAVVANSRMNRERNASGVNSYEQEFKFKPEEFLEQQIQRSGFVSWLDLCCGQGNALIQSAEFLAGKELQHKARLKGIDLLDAFRKRDDRLTCLDFEPVPLAGWKPDRKYDLITCVHGLHYIGDKLRIIETALTALAEDGLFIANLDLQNIRINGKDASVFLKKQFAAHGIDYHTRSKIIRRKSTLVVELGLKFLGSDDTTGPNYTGQEAVTSHYSQ